MGSMIYQAIAGAMEDISPIAKGKRNKEQGFQYRGVDDVMNELSPILAKRRIFVYPEVIKSERSERQTKSGGTLLYSILTVKYHFAAEDGSEVCATVIGEGMDSGDKASNKAMAVAFKYACLQMFCIPTDDMPDPDKNTSPPSSPKQPASQQQQRQQPPNEGGGEQKRLADEIGKIANALDPASTPYFSDQEKEGLRNVIRNARGNVNMLREQMDSLLAEFKKREETFIRNDQNGNAGYLNPPPENLPGDGFVDNIPF